MKQKHIESFLQDVQDFNKFEKEKLHLEQYMTPPKIASQMIYIIYSLEENLESKIFADFGSGTGMLTQGLLYIGTKKVVCYDIDKDYIKINKRQLNEKFGNGEEESSENSKNDQDSEEQDSDLNSDEQSSSNQESQEDDIEQQEQKQNENEINEQNSDSHSDINREQQSQDNDSQSSQVEELPFEILNCDIAKHNFKENEYDGIVMNPPFGTKTEHIDWIFLQQAMKASKGNIYSIHKSTTRDFLEKGAIKNGYNFKVLETFEFPLEKKFKKFHKKDVAYTKVDFIMLSPQ